MQRSQSIDDTHSLAREFRAFIERPEFPCVGAKSALARGTLKIVVARDIRSAWNDVQIHDELLGWAYQYSDDPTGLRSLAVVFETAADLSEDDFECCMWERLQSLADKDVWRGQHYDPAVSPDPEDPHFSLSFGGEAFFAVGLHARASRPARRFPYPTIVFNLHDQFERLRAEGRYERMRERIIERDVALAGAPNPMLARHGEASEAAQYSGRQVPSDWTCPFRDRRVAA